MKTVKTNGHTIMMQTFPSEKIWYDGNEVAKSFNLVGSVTHRFTTDEAGEQANYEVKMWAGMLRNRAVVKRNGTMIYED